MSTVDGWPALAAAMRQCTACPELVASRQQVVVGDVGPSPRLVLLGEAPGAQEDQTGRPFVGRSGQLLDRLLTEVGLDRSEVAVVNTIKCRPPANRPPTKDETARCHRWTTGQLDLLPGLLVVALGLSATRWFLGPVALNASRGRVHEVGERRVLATYHPSAALRSGPSGPAAVALRHDLALAATAA